MKRFLLPVLAAALLCTTACNNAEKTDGTTNEQTAGGNAGDNAMNSSTTGDTTTANMPANAGDAGNSAAEAGTAKGGVADAGGYGAAPGSMGDPNGPTAPHKDDKEFMMSAAHSDQNEIQQSKMALAKGVTGMAKDMANKMIADHTKSTADLKVIAAKKGVTLPTDMDAEHKAMAPMMEKLSGKEFEAKYMAQMVADHQKTANTMMAHEKMTQDADLKGFIGKVLPVVQQHLGMAHKSSDMKM
jgi:putative membrane protein